MARRYSKIYVKAEVYGIVKGSKVHELLFTNEIEGEDFFSRIEKEEFLTDGKRIGGLFKGNEELRSSELIKRIKEEFDCGDKAAYAKLKKGKAGACRRGREVYYVKENFVDSVQNVEESRDYQQRVVKEFMEELDIGEGGEGDGGGEYDGELPGREELEKKFGLR